MNGIFKVVNQGQPFTRQKQEAEGGLLKVCNITLQELGGKYADRFYAALLGNLAECRFYEGELVAASLRFSAREYNGTVFQDISVTDIQKIRP